MGVLTSRCQIRARKAREAKLREDGADRRRENNHIDDAPVFTPSTSDYYTPTGPQSDDSSYTNGNDFSGGGGSGGGGGADGSW